MQAGGLSPRIGIWGLLQIPALGTSVAAEVISRELGRRIPGAGFTRYAPRRPNEPNPYDMGRPVVAPAPGGPASGAEPGPGPDCVVVTGEVPPDEWSAILGWPGGSVPVVWSSVAVPGELPAEAGEALARPAVLSVRDSLSADRVRRAGRQGPVEVVPDPAVLMARLWDREILARRLRSLRAEGAYPEEETPLVVQCGPEEMDAEEVEPLAAAIRDLDLPIVVAGMSPGEDRLGAALALAVGPRARWVSRLGLQDVGAAIAHGAGFVGSSPAGCAAAVAYDRPYVLLGWADQDGRRAAAEALGDPGAVVTQVGDVPDAFRAAAGRSDRVELRRGLEDALDRHLDAVAEVTPAPVPPPLPEEATEALLRALRVRGRMLAAQRWQMAERVEDPRERIAELERQLAELRATKTFRYTAAVRRWYGRRRRRRAP